MGPVINDSRDLKSYVDTLQLNINTTHTYFKYNTDISILYQDKYQFIRGKDYYGGIRDLTSYVFPFQYIKLFETGTSELNSYLMSYTDSNLSSEIVIEKNKSFSDIKFNLKASLSGFNNINLSIKPKHSIFKDMYSYLNIFKHSISDIGSSIGYHTPSDLVSNISSHSYLNLPVELIGKNLSGQSDFYSAIDKHDYSNIKFMVKSIGTMFKDINTYIIGRNIIGISNVNSIIGSHLYADLSSFLKLRGENIEDNLMSYIIGEKLKGVNNLSILMKGIASETNPLIGSLHGWQIEDVHSIIDRHNPSDLQKTITTHLPRNLNTIIKGWTLNNTASLSNDLHGWHSINVIQSIGTHKSYNIKTFIKGWSYSNPITLPGNVFGWEERLLNNIIKQHEPSNLRNIIKVWKINSIEDLRGVIRVWIKKDIPSFIATEKPRDISNSIRGWTSHTESTLKGHAHGWVEKLIGGDIELHQPASLNSSVFVTDAPKVTSSIKGWSLNNVMTIPNNIFGWQELDISSFVGGHKYYNLRHVIKVYSKVETFDIGITLHSWQEVGFSSSIDKHLPSNINYSIWAIQSRMLNFPGSIYGWHQLNIKFNIGSHKYSNLYHNIHSWQEIDLPYTITSHIPENLSSNIKQHLPVDILLYLNVMLKNKKDISSYFNGILRNMDVGIDVSIKQHLPINLSTSIKINRRAIYDIDSFIIGKLKTGDRNILTLIASHDPKNLPSFIRQCYTSFNNVSNELYGILRKGTSNIPSVIDNHLPVDIPSYIKLTKVNYKFLSYDIVGEKRKGGSNFTSTIDKHSHHDYYSFLRCNSREIKNIKYFIYGWGRLDLKSNITGLVYRILTSNVLPVPSINLKSYIKVRPQASFNSYIYGYDRLDLVSSIKIVYYGQLNSVINTHIHKSLVSYVKGNNSVYSNLNIDITGLTYYNINSIIKCTYIADVFSFLNPVVHVNLNSSTYGWHMIEFKSMLNIVDYQYDLGGTIISNDNFRNITNMINPVLSSAIKKDINFLINVLDIRDLGSIISLIPTVNLKSFIEVDGGARDLFSSIYPKYIKILKLLPIISMSHRNISSIINVSCKFSGHVDLQSVIDMWYQRNIYSNIEGRLAKPTFISDLSSTIGNSNIYNLVDKFKLKVRLTDDYYFINSRLKLNLKLFSMSSYISSSIKCIYTASDIGSTIFGDWLFPYGFEESRSRVKVKTDKDKFEIIEISFKSVVKDYLYNKALGKPYKIDSVDKWVLGFNSYISKNEKLNIKRRFKKTIDLYELTDFKTLDKAVKFVISELTGIYSNDLNCNLNITGGVEHLKSELTCNGGSDFNNLHSCIDAKRKSVLLLVNDNLQVIN